MKKAKISINRNRPVLQTATGAFIILLFFGVVVYSRKIDEKAEVFDDKQDLPIVQTPQAVEESPAPVAENNQSAPATQITQSPQPVKEKPVEVTPVKPTSTYKDGLYTATGSYSSPGGREQLVLSLTIANDVVTASTFIPKASNPTSKEFQKEFAAKYKQFVIGKDINTLSLGKVAGSSLTIIGFNAAVEQIKVQAKS